MRILVLFVVVAGCSKSAEPTQGNGSAARPEPPATTRSTDDLVKFCTNTYFKMMDCFKDDEFWQVFSTMYFANTNLATNDEDERAHWIGVMKEDLLKLYNDKEFEKNCQATIEHNKLPTEASIKKVDEAAKKSCAAFGGAYGYMIFNEGAFHDPR